MTPIANPIDHAWNDRLFLLWAGAYASHRVYVWADSFDSAVEEACDYWADTAPGVFHDIDYQVAAAELGVEWDPSCPDEYVIERAEADMMVIGHTTYEWQTGPIALASWEWGGAEVTDDDRVCILSRSRLEAA